VVTKEKVLFSIQEELDKTHLLSREFLIVKEKGARDELEFALNCQHSFWKEKTKCLGFLMMIENTAFFFFFFHTVIK